MLSVEHMIAHISSMFPSNAECCFPLSVVPFLLGLLSFFSHLCDFLALIQNLGKLLAIDLRPFSSFAESILMPCLVYVSAGVQKRCGQATLTGGECVEDGNEPQSRPRATQCS